MFDHRSLLIRETDLGILRVNFSRDLSSLLREVKIIKTYFLHLEKSCKTQKNKVLFLGILGTKPFVLKSVEMGEGPRLFGTRKADFLALKLPNFSINFYESRWRKKQFFCITLCSFWAKTSWVFLVKTKKNTKKSNNGNKTSKLDNKKQFYAFLFLKIQDYSFLLLKSAFRLLLENKRVSKNTAWRHLWTTPYWWL